MYNLKDIKGLSSLSTRYNSIGFGYGNKIDLAKTNSFTPGPGSYYYSEFGKKRTYNSIFMKQITTVSELMSSKNFKTSRNNFS